MMMTAAGTVPAAKVLVVGAGVAGCSAAYHLSLLTQQQGKEAKDISYRKKEQTKGNKEIRPSKSHENNLYAQPDRRQRGRARRARHVWSNTTKNRFIGPGRGCLHRRGAAGMPGWLARKRVSLDISRWSESRAAIPGRCGLRTLEWHTSAHESAITPVDYLPQQPFFISQ